MTVTLRGYLSRAGVRVKQACRGAIVLRDESTIYDQESVPTERDPAVRAVLGLVRIFFFAFQAGGHVRSPAGYGKRRLGEGSSSPGKKQELIATLDSTPGSSPDSLPPSGATSGSSSESGR